MNARVGHMDGANTPGGSSASFFANDKPSLLVSTVERLSGRAQEIGGRLLKRLSLFKVDRSVHRNSHVTGVRDVPSSPIVHCTCRSAIFISPKLPIEYEVSRKYSSCS